MSEDELMTKDDKSQKEASHHEGDAADAGNRRVSYSKVGDMKHSKREHEATQSKQNQAINK